MKNLKYTPALFLLVLLGLIGCSDVGFKSLPSKTCQDFNTQGQTCIPGLSTNTYNYSFRTGDVDILIVNDNSGSMFPEQQKMATQFPTFLSSINHLFYQIAMVTTDITSPESGADRPANGNGAWRDGKFLPFAAGEYVLTKTTPNLQAKFNNTIQRAETAACGADGNFEGSACPSGDERGIYAMNLAAQRNEQSFFRAGAHLAVIILSDEDERSSAAAYGPGGTRPLANLDLPETFLQTMLDKYPTKTVSVHSVIIRPGDLACKQSQIHTVPGSPVPLRGFEGFMYAELSAPQTYNPNLLSYTNFAGGVLGNICANNYGAQLGSIGSFVSSEATNNEIQLPCSPAANDVSVTSSNGSSVNYSINSSNRMIFSNLPVGVTVSVSVVCPASI
jgi:hypothetical protein